MKKKVMTKNFYRLIQGDCLKILPTLEKESVDLIVADPPYNLIGLDAFVDLHTYRKWFKKWMLESFRVLKWNGSFILCGRPPVLAYLLVDVCEEGNVFREWITWHKVDSITPSKEYHSRNYEVFSVFSKWIEHIFNFVPIDAKTNHYSKKRNIGCVWSHPKISRHHKEGTNHPTQKPLVFMKRFIETFTKKADVVLDLFSGSGTVMDASIELERSCVSVELNPEYCDIVRKRCFGRQFLDREVEYSFETVS